MAAVTSVNILSSSSNTGSIASGAFTPAADDLLLVAVYASGSAAATPTLSSSVSGKTFSLVGSAAGKATSADNLYLFVADQLASAESQTVTFDTSDNVTGTVMNLYRVSGVTVTGTSAIRQSGKQENAASSTTPAVTLSSACQTGNPVIAATYNSSTAPTAPASWTAGATASHTSPTQRGSAYYRDSGETGSTITWGGTSASEHCSIVAEIETATVVNLTGQGVTVSKGFAIVNPVSEFTDSFGSFDTAKWTATNTNGTVSVVDGTLDLTTGGAAGDHATATSVGTYSLQGSEAYIKLVRPYLGTVDADGARLVFRLYNSADGGDRIEWFVQTDGVLCTRITENGGLLDNTNISSDWATSGYDWLKISANAAGDTVTWWTAPDSSGVPGTWTSRKTYTPPYAINSMKVMLWVENWGTGHGAITQSGRFDGLNGPLTGDTSITLTGSAVTPSRGTLVPATDSALTGQAVTAARDTLTPEVAVALTGQAVTVGREAPTTTQESNVALTGQAVTVSRDTLVPAVDAALTGQAVTAARDTLTPLITYEAALTGQAVTVARDTLAPATAITLTGQAVTPAKDTLGVEVTVALTGQAVTVAREAPTTTQESNVTLTGQAVTAARDILVPAVDAALTGQAVTTARDTLVPGTATTLTSQVVTASKGSMDANGTTSDAPEAVYTGGVAGFWLDATPISRFDTTDTSGVACTAYGDLMGRWNDRSGNNYDLYITDEALRGFADTQASPEDWRFYGYLPYNQPGTIDTAGGSSTAFYFAAAVTVRSYYGTIYSDVSSSDANTGFNIRHNADDNAITFSAGTGSSRVTVSKTRPFPAIFTTPSDTQPWVIEAWWDGTNLHLGIDGVYATPVACGTVSAGQTTVLLGETTNATLKAPDRTDDDPCAVHFYEVTQAKNSVPAVATRDAVRAYLTDRITSGGARGLVGQAATASRGTLVPATDSAMVGQAVTTARDTLTPEISTTLVGQAVTSAYGTLTPTADSGSSVNLTGQAVTVTRDTLVPAVDAALVGQAVITARDTLAPTTAITLTGQAVTAARDTLVPGSAVALVGQEVTAAKGTPLAGNFLTLLTDDFETASLDTAKWVASSTNGTVSIASGTLDLTTTGAAGAHATITSVDTYTLADSEAYVKLVRPCLGTNDIDGARTIMRIFDSATGKHGDYVEWWVESNGIMGARTCNDGSILNNVHIHSDWATSGYDWLKLSLSDTTATWWTAPDNGGSPGTWTSRHTYSSLPSAFTSVQVTLWLENWGTGQGTITQSARFDGFNTSTVSGASVALTGKAVTVGRGTPTIASSSSPTLTGAAVTVGRGIVTAGENAFSVALTSKLLTIARGSLTAFNNYVLLTDFGAVGDGVTNNLTAFQNAFTDSVNTGRTILVTEGTFAFSGDVLRMTGAKMEGLNHNCVIHALDYTKASTFIRGTGTVLRNVKLTTAGTYDRNAPYEYTKVAILGASSFTVDRVRIEHSPAASIQTGEAANNGVISNCSIYDSEADSIHVSDRCSFIEIHNNEIYNSGDDGIACVSYLGQSTACHHITAHHNKIINNTHGRNMSVVGGEDNYYYQNYLEGNVPGYAGIISVCEDNVDFQTHPVKRCRYEYNTIKNCGSSTVHAAVMPINEASTRTNDDIDFVRNWVIDDRSSPAQGFRLFGPQTNVLLDRNKIDNGSGEDYSGVSGDPDITLILYDSGTYGQTEPVGPTSIVDIALTGKAVTAGRGSLSPSVTVDVTLAGKLLTTARGILDPANTLSGKLLTASRGTLTPKTSITLVGKSATAQRGPLSPGFDQSAPLVGKAVTTSRGALVPKSVVAITGQAVTPARGTLTPGTGTSLLATLTDTFTGGTVDTTKWVAFTNGTNSSVTQDGDLIVDIDGDVALPASYVPYPTTGVNSAGTYKVQGSSAYVRATPPVTTVDDWGMVQTIFGVINAGTSPNTPNDEGFGFVITSHPTKKLRFKVWNDLGDEWEVNVTTEINYDATNHKWLRLRESGGTLYWDTAPDSGNGPGTWTQRASYSTALLTDFQSITDFLNTSRATLRVLHNDNQMADSYITSAARFDGFNTNRTGPTLVALTGQAATTSRGSLVPTIGAALSGRAVTISQGVLTSAAGATTLTGQATTTAAGTLAPSVSIELTGQAVTSTRGGIDPTYSADLTGQAVTVAKETLGTSAPGDVTPNSHAVATRAGAMGVDAKVELVGQGLTTAQQAFIAEITRPLTGYGLVLSQGLFSLASSRVTLTGQGVTTRQGVLASALDSDVTTAWTPVTSTQSGAWTPPDTAQTPAWDEPETEQTPGWSS